MVNFKQLAPLMVGDALVSANPSTLNTVSQEQLKPRKNKALAFWSNCMNQRSNDPGGWTKRWLMLMTLLLSGFALDLMAMVGSEPSVAPVTSGELWLIDEQGDKRPASLSQTTAIDVNIKGLLAHVRLTQSFSNPTAGWVEGEYLFPLPEKAVIHQFEMQVGERRIKGLVKEKQEAKKIFTEAKSAGKKVSMLTQQRPNLFTTQVANIGPAETITVVMEYIEQVQYQDGEFQLRLPTTLTPRFLVSPDTHRPKLASVDVQSTGEEFVNQPLSFAADGWAGSNQAISGEFVNPPQGGMFRLSASLDMGVPLAKVESLYHRIKLSTFSTLSTPLTPSSLQESQPAPEPSANAHGFQISLAAEAALMDRDFVLVWRPSTGALPAAGLFREQVNGDEYGLLMMIPPGLNKSQQITTPQLAKEVTYVIDTSGSMGGPSIRQAKHALLQAVERLKPSDSFNIIEFNSTTRQLFPSPYPVNTRTIHTAKRYIRQLEAGGGTVMLPALQLALGKGSLLNGHDDVQGHSGQAAKVRQVVFITDGAVSNEQALMTLVHDQLGDRRLFTIGIGSAPNSYFMRKIAEFGRGTFTYIGHVHEVETQMGRLFNALENPQMMGITVNWPETMDVEHYPRRIPDLYQGEPLLIVFKMDRKNVAVSEDGIKHQSLLLEGMLADQPWSQPIQLAPISAGGQTPGIAKRWVREKIESLLDQKASGVPNEQIRQQVLPLALAHQVVSPFTRFIAVDEVLSRPPNDEVKKHPVVNALPKGSQLKMIQYPNTSTGNKLLINNGILILSVFIVLLIVRNRYLLLNRFSPRTQGGVRYEA